MTTPPRVDSVSIKVTYKGGNALEMDVGIPIMAPGSDTRLRIDKAVADLIRLLMEATE